MKASLNNTWLKISVALITVVALSTCSRADDSSDTAKSNVASETVKEKVEKKNYRLTVVSKTRTPVDGFESVEMFAAMTSGDIEVLLKAKDATASNIMVTNHSDRPLAIEMPATFSAVPVLRQLGGGMGGMGGGGMGGMGGGGMGGGGMGGGMGGGQQQGIGGGMGGGMGGGGMGGGGMGGGGMGGGGMGGGVFNIPPGKTGRIQVKTVCLEAGKPDPSLPVDYVIQPLADLTSDVKIAEMCRMLANDEISQPVAQAAAWHITDDLSWHELLVKNRVELMDGSYERFFHPNHLLFAQQVVKVATERAEFRAKLEKEAQQSSEKSRVSTVERNN